MKIKEPVNGLNLKGTNKDIKFHLIDNEEMAKVGFRYIEPTNCWCAFLPLREDELLIDIKLHEDGTVDNDRSEIAVLDTYYLQHYDFQHILRHNPDHIYALQVQQEVENILERLTDIGIITGHERYDYI